MELTLKDESVIEIGRAVGNNVNSLTGGGGTSLVPVGAGAKAGPPAVVAQPMNPFDSMMTVLGDIRDGIYSLVDKFSDSVSLQKDQIQDANMAQDLSQVADAGEGASDEGTDPAPKQSFFSKAKDKVKSLMGMGGFKGMLIKGGLIFGLLGIAKLMQKYGKEIAEKVAPIVDGVKAFFSAFTDDIGPIFDSAVETVKSALTGIIDIVKGLFTGDASTFFGGVKKLFVDFPIQLVSYIGDAFFSLLENALAAFGIESEMVTDIKNFFRELPEKISELFKNIGEFFTVTIPTKLQEIKDSITNFFNDNIVTPIKSLWTDIGNFFTVTVPEKYNEIVGNVTEFFTGIVTGIKGFFTDAFDFVTETIPEKMSEITKGIADKFVSIKDQIIDFAMAPFRKIRELFDNLVIGILESVEDIPLIGGKAKEMKESILQKREAKAAALEETETKNTAFTRLAADTKKYENQINDFMAMSGYQFDMEKSLMAYEQGMNKLQFSKNGGRVSSSIAASTFDDMNEIKYILERGSNIGYVPPTTGGATGGELNGAGAEFVASGNGASGGDANTYIEGARVNTVSSNQTHMTEDTGSNDKSYKDAILN
jgi:hypothetical protein